MRIRAFISINLPVDVKQSIAEFRRGLETAGADVGWTKPDSLHLTLKFLGEAEETMIGRIEREISAAAAEFSPFEITLDDKGVFPDWRRPRIVWLGCRHPNPQLPAIFSAIEAATTSLGFSKETRSFQPHLTIGRIRSGRRLAELREKIENSPLESRSFVVRAVHLMRSHLKSSGAEYEEIAEFELRNAE